jgi:outer membrane protein assembly factor BamB
MGHFKPPLRLVQSIELPGITEAASLLVFENNSVRHFLVGQETTESVEYHLFDAADGTPVWNPPVTLQGATGHHRYQPSYSNGIVILGGGTTTFVKAVHVTTRTELWSDNSVGTVDGRYPALTNGLALYHGANRLVGANPLTGSSFYQLDVTTAEAPVSVHEQRAYLLERSGTMHSIDTADGTVNWSFSGFSDASPSIISTEKYVFLVKPDNSTFGALAASDGSLLWGAVSPILSRDPALALAYDQLYLFASDDGEGSAGVDVHNPDTGERLWSVRETGGAGLEYGTVVNNVVYYYHLPTSRIRARDAFTGNLLWSQRQEGVRGLSFSDGQLYVLTSDRVSVFRVAETAIFAHIADGGGQQTLVTLSNQAKNEVSGTLQFIGTDGTPLNLEVEGEGMVSSVDFAIPPSGSTQIQTLGGENIKSGWARVLADGPVVGSSIFQFLDTDGLILNEAGVASASLTGNSSIHTMITIPPASAQRIDTGVAIANPNGETANVTYTLLATDGTPLNTVQKDFEAQAQEAIFVAQLFPDETDLGFTGTLVISSDLPIVITALRTQKGLQLSSYAAQ